MPLELAKKYKSIQMDLYTNQNCSHILNPCKGTVLYKNK